MRRGIYWMRNKMYEKALAFMYSSYLFKNKALTIVLTFSCLYIWVGLIHESKKSFVFLFIWNIRKDIVYDLLLIVRLNKNGGWHIFQFLSYQIIIVWIDVFLILITYLVLSWISHWWNDWNRFASIEFINSFDQLESGINTTTTIIKVKKEDNVCLFVFILENWI